MVFGTLPDVPVLVLVVFTSCSDVLDVLGRICKIL